MNSSIAKLLSQVYELEGLLLVVDKHGDETPQVVYDMMKQKAAALHNMAQLLEIPEQPQPEPEPVIPPVQEPEEQPSADEPTDEPTLPADDYDKEETWQHDNGEEFKEILSGFDYQEPPRIPVTDDQPAEAEQEEEPPVFSKPADDEEEQDLRVDEILHRNLSKDLRKAVSLNDHFRFRRELFSNSDPEMTETLNLVETMASYQEAEEYFYNDLGWDPDNEDVADFMAIIKKHFL